jgi:hypothetical protein
MGNRKSSGEQAGLFEPPKVKVQGGPVYQGVCAQLRAMFPTDAADLDERAEQVARKDAMSGYMAQARSVAASIDRVSGHPIGGVVTRQAAGMQLAALHNQLAELLDRLSPDSGEVDEFELLQRDMREADERAAAAARVKLGEPAPDYDDVPGRG